MLSAIVPMLLLTIAYSYIGMYPFGDKSVLIMDMSAENVDFIASIRQLFGDKGSLFYSWSKGLGGNYMGLYAFFASSPLFLLTALFPAKELPAVLLALSIIRPGLCGLTFSIFLDKIFSGRVSKRNTKENKFNENVRTVRGSCAVVIFSVCYALMSYNVVYGMAMMWLDAVILLPLVLLGVEHILNNGSSKLFCVSIMLCFITNYYVSYMVGIFSFFYLVYRAYTAYELIKLKEFLIRFFKFMGASIVAAGLSMWILLPALYSLFQGKIADESGFSLTGLNYSIFDLPSKFIGKYDSIKYSGSPNIYCGIIIVILMLLYFLNRNIKLKERIASLVFLGFMLICTYVTALDQVWHVFRQPNWFPCRYSFLISFLMIYLAYRQYVSIDTSIYTSAVRGALKERALELSGFRGRKIIAVIYIAVTVITCLELLLVSIGTLKGLDNEFGYETNASYADMFDEITPLLNKAKELEGDDFYRVEKTFERSKNDALSLGYNGVTHYSSAYDLELNRFIKGLGMAQDWMWSGYYGSTPITDSILNIRYILDDYGSDFYLYNKAASNAAYVMYNNPYALSVGFMADSGIMQYRQGDDYFENEDLLLRLLTGGEDSTENNLKYFDKLYIKEYSTYNLLDEMKPEQEIQGTLDKYNYSLVNENDKGTISFSIETDKNAPLYLYFPTNDTHEHPSELYINDEYVCDYFTSDTRGLIYAGNFNAEETINVRLVLNENNVIMGYPAAAQFNTDSFISSVEELSGESLKVEEYTGNTLKGSISAAGDKDILFTSIPYDKSWNVIVDGERAETLKLCNSLLGIRLSEGEHYIEMSYISGGFTEGLSISVITLVLCIAYFVNKKYRQGSRNSKRDLSLDAIKGFLILVVMLGHVISHNKIGTSYLYNIIEGIQMPAFMAVSGYLCGFRRPVGSVNEWWSIIKKRFISYGIPFFMWLVLKQWDDLYNGVINTLFQLERANWFLMTLLVLNIMLYSAQLLSIGFEKRGKNIRIISIGAVFALFMSVLLAQALAGNAFLSPMLTIRYSVPFIAGYVCCCYREELGRLGPGLKNILLVICAAGFLFISYRVDYTVQISLIIRNIGALLGTYAIFRAVYLMKDGRIKERLALLGQYTLEIYVVHYHFSTLINFGEVNLSLLSVRGILFTFAAFLAMSAVSAAFIYIVKRVPFMSLLMFGRSTKP